MNMNEIGEQTREFYRRQGELRERERILAEVEKLRPITDSKQQVFFAPFELILAAIKGENK